MKNLKLVLKRKWYDMIASGEKREEYREIKPYWQKRFKQRYDTVTFYLGYAKDRPSMTFNIEALIFGKGRSEWGAEEWRYYYIIKLGKRII